MDFSTYKKYFKNIPHHANFVKHTFAYLTHHDWLSYPDDCIEFLESLSSGKNTDIYYDCVAALIRYINSRDCSIPHYDRRYERQYYLGIFEYWGLSTAFKNWNAKLNCYHGQLPKSPLFNKHTQNFHYFNKFNLLTFLNFVVCSFVSSNAQNTIVLHQGMLAHFDNGCPPGWSPVANSGGRSLIGTGNGFSDGQSGGQSSISLTKSNLPAITLQVPILVSHCDMLPNHDKPDQIGTCDSTFVPGFSAAYREDGGGITSTDPLGSSAPLSVRNPYIAKVLCRLGYEIRINSTDAIHQQITAVATDLVNLSDQIGNVNSSLISLQQVVPFNLINHLNSTVFQQAYQLMRIESVDIAHLKNSSVQLNNFFNQLNQSIVLQQMRLSDLESGALVLLEQRISDSEAELVQLQSKHNQTDALFNITVAGLRAQLQTHDVRLSRLLMNLTETNKALEAERNMTHHAVMQIQAVDERQEHSLAQVRGNITQLTTQFQTLATSVPSLQAMVLLDARLNATEREVFLLTTAFNGSVTELRAQLQTHDSRLSGLLMNLTETNKALEAERNMTHHAVMQIQAVDERQDEVLLQTQNNMTQWHMSIQSQISSLQQALTSVSSPLHLIALEIRLNETIESAFVFRNLFNTTVVDMQKNLQQHIGLIKHNAVNITKIHHQLQDHQVTTQQVLTRLSANEDNLNQNSMVLSRVTQNQTRDADRIHTLEQTQDVIQQNLQSNNETLQTTTQKTQVNSQHIQLNNQNTQSNSQEIQVNRQAIQANAQYIQMITTENAQLRSNLNRQLNKTAILERVTQCLLNYLYSREVGSQAGLNITDCTQGSHLAPKTLPVFVEDHPFILPSNTDTLTMRLTVDMLKLMLNNYDASEITIEILSMEEVFFEDYHENPITRFNYAALAKDTELVKSIFIVRSSISAKPSFKFRYKVQDYVSKEFSVHAKINKPPRIRSFYIKLFQGITQTLIDKTQLSATDPDNKGNGDKNGQLEITSSATAIGFFCDKNREQLKKFQQYQITEGDIYFCRESSADLQGLSGMSVTFSDGLDKVSALLQFGFSGSLVNGDTDNEVHARAEKRNLIISSSATGIASIAVLLAILICYLNNNNCPALCRKRRSDQMKESNYKDADPEEAKGLALVSTSSRSDLDRVEKAYAERESDASEGKHFTGGKGSRLTRGGGIFHRGSATVRTDGPQIEEVHRQQNWHGRGENVELVAVPGEQGENPETGIDGVLSRP